MKTCAIYAWGICGLEHPQIMSFNLKEKLHDLGIELVPITRKSVDLLIFFEFRREAKKLLKKTQKENRALFTIEPQSVNPFQYLKRSQSKFGKVFVISPLFVSNESQIYFDWFCILEKVKNFSPDINSNQERRIALSIVNANKFSFTKNSQYMIRTRLIKQLSTLGIEIIVAGNQWQINFLNQFYRQLKSFINALINYQKPNWKGFYLPLKTNDKIRLIGTVENEIEHLQKFEYALVIENDSQYLSEKLFNAICAGCVPLYFGPNLKLFGIPEAVAINISEMKPDKIVELASNKEVCINVKVAGQVWFNQPETQKYWSQEAAAERIAGLISDFALSQMSIQN